jgi:hypothetical protein
MAINPSHYQVSLVHRGPFSGATFTLGRKIESQQAAMQQARRMLEHSGEKFSGSRVHAFYPGRESSTVVAAYRCDAEGRVSENTLSF